jgi:hypothetical protein
MRRLWLFSLLPIVAACATQPLTRSQQETRPIVVNDEMVEDALDAWRRYDLPPAPAGAQLVVLSRKKPVRTDGSRDRDYQSLAFIIAKATATRAGYRFNGIGEATYGPGDYEYLEPEAAIVPEMEFLDGEQGFAFELNLTFAVGLHCWARGYTQLGRDVIARALPESDRSTQARVRDTVAGAVWLYWMNMLLAPDSDRRQVLEHLKAAVAEFELLQEVHSWLGDSPTSICKGLEDALEATQSEPGTPEFWIDALVDMRVNFSPLNESWARRALRQDSAVAPLRELVLLGFDAVPALIEHIDDSRVTRSRAWFAFAEGPSTVGAIVEELLHALSATSEFDTDSPHEMHRWWREAQAEGEKACMLELAEEMGEDLGDDDVAATVGVMILGHKYPDALVELYLKVVDRPGDRDVEPMIIAIAASSLDASAKATALKKGATAKRPVRRVAALRALQPLDDDAFAALVTERLDSLDGKLDRAWPPGGDAIQYADLAQLTDNTAVWEALTRLAKRAEPNLRVRILGRFGGEHDVVRDRKRWLGFLASFLTDEEVRRREDDAVEGDACLAWGTISIRNFAASRIAEIMRIKPTPEPDWDETHWTEHRGRVREALAAEGIEVP